MAEAGSGSVGDPVTDQSASARGNRQIVWVATIAALGLAASWCISLKLWVSTRSYPLTPVVPRLPAIPYPLDYALVGIVLVLLCAVPFVPRRRPVLIAIVTGVALLWMGDQSRWQMWCYQYLVMLIALAAYSWRPDDEAGREAALNSCRIVVAGVYFWSGLQKVNFSFMLYGFPSLMEPMTSVLSPGLARVVNWTGFVVPVAEAGIGVGLLLSRTRRFAAAAALGMHAFLLLLLGPLVSNYNPVVWPWNAAMMGFLVVLFLGFGSVEAQHVMSPRYGRLHVVVVILFWVMPALSLVGLWDSYLSAALYSSNIKVSRIYISDGVRRALPAEVQAYVERAPDGRYVLRPSTWSTREMRAVAYPEYRVFRNIARAVCRHAAAPSDVILEIDGPSRSWLWNPSLLLTTGRRMTVRDSCATL